MSAKRYKPEDVIRKLREVEVLSGQGVGMDEAIRRIGVTKNTYYRWRKEFGGLRTDQAQRMKYLEKENGRLKKMVADLLLDNQILKEAASGN